MEKFIFCAVLAGYFFFTQTSYKVQLVKPKKSIQKHFY